MERLSEWCKITKNIEDCVSEIGNDRDLSSSYQKELEHVKGKKTGGKEGMTWI